MLQFFPDGPGLAWALAIVPLAAYLHGLLGLGFVTVAMPLLVMVFDVRMAMVLTVPAALTLSIQLIFFGGNLRESVGRYWYLPLCMAIGAVSGAWIFQHADQRLLLLIIAGALTLFLSVDYVKKTHVHLPASWVHPAGVLFGFLAGNTETSVNMGVPFLLIFFLFANLSPLAMVQSVNMCFFSGKAVHFVTLSLGGDHVAAVTWLEWMPGLIIAPLCIWLCHLGAQRRSKTPVETYRRWLKNFMKAMVLLVLGKVVLL